MDDPGNSVEQEARQVARGRRWYSPFAVIGGVAALVWTVAGLIVAIALLIWIFG